MKKLKKHAIQVKPGDDERIAKRIRDRRNELNLEQQKAAPFAGITPKQWSDIENGRIRILAQWLPGIAAVLGCTVAELMGEAPLQPGEVLLLDSNDFVIFLRPGSLERLAKSLAGHRVYSTTQPNKTQQELVEECCKVPA